ncbi:MAG: thioesterase family protein [Polyangiaceae bacterium]
MIPYLRPIHFEEIDAAGVVFFGKFYSYTHEAMEHFFDGVEGHYAGLITKRKIGLPAVNIETRYLAPLRYGDVIRVETTTVRVGNRSATLRYRIVRTHDEVLSAEVLHTVVSSDLTEMKSCDMPEDVRRVLEAHLEPSGSSASG